MKYSLCLTNYNRYEMLIESFAQVIDDERIDDIIISDDASDVEIYNKLVAYFSVHKYGYKVTMWRNPDNLGMYWNKYKAIIHAKNDWVIIFDSDNKIDKSYLDALKWIDLNEKTVYCPSLAKPNFDYRPFEGNSFDKNNIGDLLKYPLGECCANTMNFLVNQKHYVVQNNPEVRGTDTLWQWYLLLKEGMSFYIVPNMHYIHNISPDSEFLKHLDHNMDMCRKLKQLILNLK